MWKKVFLACLVVLSIAVLGVMGPGAGSEAEACVSCEGVECKQGGAGEWCREFHYPDGSVVCEWIDGCMQ